MYNWRERKTDPREKGSKAARKRNKKIKRKLPLQLERKKGETRKKLGRHGGDGQSSARNRKIKELPLAALNSTQKVEK